MNETWKKHPTLKDIEISSLGSIRRVSNGFRFKPSVKPKGYLYITLKTDDKRKNYYVHRLVADCFLRSQPNKEINHINGNKADNRAVNLEWLTHQENMQHALKTGLWFPRLNGGGLTHCKLTKTDVLEIKLLISQGLKRQEIADRFNVSIYTVRDIKGGVTWKEIKLSMTESAN